MSCQDAGRYVNDLDLIRPHLIYSSPVCVQAIARLLEEEPTENAEECIPAWISFSCRDQRHVSHGETLAECVRALEGCTRVVAVGVNCTPPRFILGLVTEARKVSKSSCEKGVHRLYRS